MLPVVVDVTRIVTKIMISDAHHVCSFTALAHGVTSNEWYKTMNASMLNGFPPSQSNDQRLAVAEL